MPDPQSPPPAYELSQQDYDTKTREVLDNSAQDEDDQWEVWDDGVHETAAQQLRGSSDVGSSSTGADTLQHQHLAYSPEFAGAFQPLNIHKKAMLLSKTKEKPSWLAEAGLEDPSSSSTFLQSNSERSSLHSCSVEEINRSGVSHSTHGLSSDDEADNAISPPPFTAVAPPMEPSFQQEVPQVSSVLSYHGDASNPPSPLTSPVVANAYLPTLPPFPPALQHAPALSTSNPHPRSLPTPHYYPAAVPPPATNSGYRTLPGLPVPVESRQPLPRMQFDPSIAYQRKRGETQQQLQFQSPPYESFYNSAVTPFLPKKQQNVPKVPAVTGPRPRPTFQYYYPNELSRPLPQSTGNPSAWMNPQVQHRPHSTMIAPAPALPPPGPAIRHSSFIAPQQAQPNVIPRQDGGGRGQGPWASSEQQMLWDMYSTPR